MNNSVTISRHQCQKLGNRIGELQPSAEDFLDADLFPTPCYESEDVARFFFFVTGIDHRTSPPNQSFEGIIDGKHFQGADLLWHLSLQKFIENSQFFHPSSMSQITTDQVSNWYTIKHPKPVTISNPGERAALLRNGGELLRDKYQGSVLNLLNTANHRVSSQPGEASLGLVQLLSEFKAYADPAKKKSYLLLKFLLRRNLWSITDNNHVRIPVDNHLARIALRTGIVHVSPKIANALRLQNSISQHTDIILRNTISEAYTRVGEFAKRSVLELDDFFWHFGRQCCILNNPVCVTGCSADCYVVKHLLNGSCHGTCPFCSICPASTDDQQRRLVEPKLKTWYY